MRNYLLRYLLDGFFIPLPGGVDLPIQFVHADDLARATWEILAQNGCRPFNLCASSWTSWLKSRDIATRGL